MTVDDNSVDDGSVGENPMAQSPVEQRPAGEPGPGDDLVRRTYVTQMEGQTVQVEVTLPPETGDSVIDEMLRSLATGGHLPPEEQVPMIEAVHRGLQDRLADVEGNPG